MGYNESLAHDAVELATTILSLLQRMEVDAEIAYGSLGNAFIRMHRGLGLNKIEWNNITEEMGDIEFEQKGD